MYLYILSVVVIGKTYQDDRPDYYMEYFNLLISFLV